MGSFPEAYNDPKYSNELTVVMSIIGREMLHDKNREIDGLNKEFQRQIQVLVEDHKKEVDVSIRCVVFIDKISSIYLTLAKFLSLTKFNLYNKYAIMIHCSFCSCNTHKHSLRKLSPV